VTDRGRERPQLRAGAYDDRPTVAWPESMETVAASRPSRLRRRFRLGEHPYAELVFGVIGFFAAASWITAALLVSMLLADRNGPENMTGLAVAVGMPPVLAAAFGFTATASSVWHRYWGDRVSLVVSIGAALGSPRALHMDGRGRPSIAPR
jgi:hypothetical protein